MHCIKPTTITHHDGTICISGVLNNASCLFLSHWTGLVWAKLLCGRLSGKLVAMKDWLLGKVAAMDETPGKSTTAAEQRAGIYGQDLAAASEQVQVRSRCWCVCQGGAGWSFFWGRGIL